METDYSHLVFENYTIGEYISHWEHRKRTYEHYKEALSYGAPIFLVAGLVALYFDFTVFAVALLAIGALMQQDSSKKDLMVDVMKEHYYLARFIATQQSSKPVK